jgi:hypothetical protein
MQIAYAQSARPSPSSTSALQLQTKSLPAGLIKLSMSKARAPGSSGVRTMASGNLSLQITEDVDRDSFPIQASEFVKRFKGTVLKRIDTPVERMWIVLIRWRPFFLAYDDFPVGLSLDSMNRLCNPVVRDLHREMESDQNK